MKKILICDDETVIRAGIKHIITSVFQEVEIKEAENGEEGYKIIVVWMPDLVITDIRMPRIDGLGMIEKAQKSRIISSYIVISAYKDFEYARTAIRCGVNDYILKPINRFEFIKCLEKLLGNEKKTEENKEEVLCEVGPIERAIGYIEDNFYRDISLEEVSDAINMNTSYFSTQFKKKTGMKYIDYLTDFRMKKARNLIMNTDLKIGAIALMVGYSSAKHFTRIYKEKFGITPNTDR